LKRARLILASASPRRRQLLKDLRVPFRIEPAEVSERSREKRPRRLAAQLALRKARAVAKKNPNALVLGADTIVSHRGLLLLKPKHRADSARILRIINGRWHRVYTGVAIVDGASGKAWREVAVSRVKARKLPEKELSRFIGRHMDKAGAYAVQDKADPFIEKIEGRFDNVVGLPMDAVRRLLREAARYRAAVRKKRPVRPSQAVVKRRIPR